MKPKTPTASQKDQILNDLLLGIRLTGLDILKNLGPKKPKKEI
jgi:hypothetical protein